MFSLPPRVFYASEMPFGKSRHLLFMASALYDSYIFFRGLQHSKEALSSQFYDFAVMLGLFGQLEVLLENNGGF